MITIDENKLSDSTLYCILMDLGYKIKDEHMYDVEYEQKIGGKMFSFEEERLDVRKYLDEYLRFIADDDDLK